MNEYGYTNGYLMRKASGSYEGEICIDGVSLSPIVGSYHQEDGRTFLWLRRKPLLEYDSNTQSYIQRPRNPRWEAYLQKQSAGAVAYKGECNFLRFKYSIVGIWDKVQGMDKERLNFFVERLPLNQQNIIKSINERNKNNNNG